MFPNSFFAVLFNLAFIAGVVFVCFYLYSRSTRISEDENVSEDSEDDESIEYEPSLIEAVVVSKRVYINKTGGQKRFSHKTAFCITFSFGENESNEFEVSQEAFDRISVGDTGLLMTQNGNFIDFGNGTDEY